uniref:Glycol-hydro-43-superfamily protein n=1 Tax=uncultured microorganism TaxID=358574 RepID=E5F2L7_9ZZZZ|nr:glycol-hydro-43-superfamily protein [uncultured microorganism]
MAKSKRALTEKDMGAYLFTFFSDPTHGLFMAISYDGYTFTAVNNGEPIISGDSIAEQHGIRDPHIYRAPNGKFYIAMTDLHIFGKQKGIRTTQWERPDAFGWGNNRGLVLMASDDLIHWTHYVARIDKLFPERFGEVACTWAPQTIWDPEVGKPMVYFSIRQQAGGRTKLYYSYADEAFTTLETEPQLLFEYPDETTQVIDADICPMPDGRYFMTYVSQDNPAGIKYMISDRINHFDDFHPEQIDAERGACEAPNVWKRIGQKKWVVMYDIYSIRPNNFGFVETSDFKTFTPLGHFNEGKMKLTNFVSPKHGSVIHITKAEAKRLEQYWSEQQKKPKTIRSGELWRDDGGRHINSHGGGILKYGDTYYWFGEHKDEKTSNAMVGVMCYASKDLVNWRNCGVALSVTEPAASQGGQRMRRGGATTDSDIERGCILERPKVIYNPVTKKFCMWFHLELKGQGYNAARYGVAVADRPEGPYKFLYSSRANAGTWPIERAPMGFDEYLKRDFGTGQMARDMTLFVDDDGKAYHIFSSEENFTLHIAELTGDYLHHTGRYTRMAPGGQNEAPAIFKHDGTYWMITSGCTGWAPNEARMFSAPSIWGPWTQHPNPCRGPKADKTFEGQSTFVLPVGDQYIFMADIWRPDHPIDARYIWLPIGFEDGKPVIHWRDEWTFETTE